MTEHVVVAAAERPGQPPIDALATVEPAAQVASSESFQVHLANFEGPFDLLLGLIAKHKLDVTEVALSQVTDEFIAHIRALGTSWDLGQATEFLVVAATLLDLKAARLLPAADVEDEEDLALLEARDILFARLLQYRAYKQAAAWLAARLLDESQRFPRSVGMEERFSGLLPEVLLGLGPVEFAALAARAFTPKPVPQLSIEHIHTARVSVRDQAAILVDRLRVVRSTTFRALTADCPDTLHVVARFLALLELFRESAVAFEQVSALGELHVRWTGTDEGELSVADEFDGDPLDEQSGASRASRRAQGVGRGWLGCRCPRDGGRPHRPCHRRTTDHHRRGVRMSDSGAEREGAEQASERVANEPEALGDASPSATLDLPDITDDSGAAATSSTGGVTHLEPALEAILMVVDEPVSTTTLAQVVELPQDDVEAALRSLAEGYEAQRRGFELREVAGGWRYYTRAEHAGVVERFVVDGQQARLTQAALETLAVVAYRQPVSRARISAVRGVSVDGVIRTLVARGLIEESGTDTESGSILFRTTPYFLERLGLTSLEELPGLAPYLPEVDTLDPDSLLSSS